MSESRGRAKAKANSGEKARSRTKDGAGQQSREATEQALIDAALVLLRERGILAGMNLREIAEEAQVTRGLAYHYFGSRQSLLRAAAKREIAHPREEVPGTSEMEFGDWLTTMLSSSFNYKEAVWLIVLLVLDHDDMVKTLTTRKQVMAKIEEVSDTLSFHDAEAIYIAFASMSYGFSLLHDHFADELQTDSDALEKRLLTATRIMFRAFQDGADDDTSEP